MVNANAVIAVIFILAIFFIVGLCWFGRTAIQMVVRTHGYKRERYQELQQLEQRRKDEAGGIMCHKTFELSEENVSHCDAECSNV